jgi:hypothetical protein
MKSTPHSPPEELKELSHVEQPGYRIAFIIVLSVTVLTLIISFLMAGEVSTFH